jgi:hypothetical protein
VELFRLCNLSVLIFVLQAEQEIGALPESKSFRHL